MTVAEATEAYITHLEPFAGTLLLGAPAITNGLLPGVGPDYLAAFLDACANCTVDFVTLHYYGDVLNSTAFTEYVQYIWTRFRKPIWITEFGAEGGSPVQVQLWLQGVLLWLDAQPFVSRYAYFMDGPSHRDPAGILREGLIAEIGDGMSALGVLYDS